MGKTKLLNPQEHPQKRFSRVISAMKNKVAALQQSEVKVTLSECTYKSGHHFADCYEHKHNTNGM